jgi:uncharacterized SAM-binding protein YcdF (DUF218 family)
VVRLALTAGLLVAMAGVIGWLTLHWFVTPTVTTDDPGPADAVVMFGGAGPRFAEAVRLAEDGTAPWLVVSDPKDPAQVWTAYGAFCQQDHAYRTVCFDPEPRTTRGEARFVADLARREGWRRIVAVTTTEQAMRAAQLLERCWDGEVQVANVTSGRTRPLRIAYEWAASLRAAVTRRGC